MRKRRRRHRPQKIVQLVLNGFRGLLFSLLAVLIAYLELLLVGDTTFFWLFFILGSLVVFPSTVLSYFKFSQPFLFPYILTMVRTRHFLNAIKALGRLGRVWEKACVGGLALGFGLAGIDYWWGRKLGGWKRVLLLIFSACLLYYIFTVFLSILFNAPIFNPLLVPALIGFIFLGLGGFMLVLLVGFGFVFLGSLFTGVQSCPAISPVIPGIEVPGFGMVLVPLVGWISLVILLVVHEAGHGLMFAYYRRKLKSVGLLLAGIVPIGAFVEEEPKEFEALSERKQLLALGAGSSSNLLTVPIAFMILVASVALVGPVLAEHTSQLYNGAKVASVQEEVLFCGTTKDGPAHGKLFEGDEVLLVEGEDVNSALDVKNIISGHSGMEEITFTVLRGSETIDVPIKPARFADLNVLMIGVTFKSIESGYSPPEWYYPLMEFTNSFVQVFFFLFILSFLIGMLNFMPVGVFDGGKMGKIILLPYFSFLGLNKKDTQILIGRIFLWIFLIAILLNLIPYITMLF